MRKLFLDVHSPQRSEREKTTLSGKHTFPPITTDKSSHAIMGSTIHKKTKRNVSKREFLFVLLKSTKNTIAQKHKQKD